MVTKPELEQAISESENRVKTELRAEIKQSAEDVKTELRAEIQTSEARLHAHIDQATQKASNDAFQRFANVVIENVRSQIAAIDDKYRDLPPAHAKLREDFEEHVHTPGLHKPRRR